MSDHSLFNADCLDILQKLEPESIDCVLCDPPYNTTPYGCSGTMGGIILQKNFQDGRGGFDNNSLTLDEYLPQIFRVMKERAHGYLMTNDLNLVEFHLKLREHGFSVYRTLIWQKNTAISNQYYMSNHEYIIFFRKGGAKSINNCGTKSVLTFNNPKPKQHPTQKPVDLLEVLIRNSTKEGETVLDFAMGSGTTGMACMRANRKFVGIEIDKKYFDIASEQIIEFAIHYGRMSDSFVEEKEEASLEDMLGL